MRRWVYEALYRLPFVSIDRVFGSTSDIEQIVESAVVGRIPPGRAITLGCGVGRESVALARLGFDVTGLDFSPTAIDRARKAAEKAGVVVSFVVDDLTHLKEVSETFDLVTDFGALSDLRRAARGLYVQNLLPLTHPDSYYFMFCFDRWFGPHFYVERFDKDPESGFPNSLDSYLMTRKVPDEPPR